MTRPIGRPKKDSPKEQISILLDADVVAKLKKDGRGWSGRVNQILRDEINRTDRDRHYAEVNAQSGAFK